VKKIKLIALLTVVASTCLIVFLNIKESKAEVCAKCTGSANCHACKTCNYCAHCNSGGSCGVCSYSEPAPAPKPKPKTEIKSSESTKRNYSNKASTSVYKVNSQSLNIRDKPALDGKVLYTLKFGSKLTVLSFVDSKWAKVQYGNILGYAYLQYLTK